MYFVSYMADRNIIVQTISSLDISKLCLYLIIIQVNILFLLKTSKS